MIINFSNLTTHNLHFLFIIHPYIVPTRLSLGAKLVTIPRKIFNLKWLPTADCSGERVEKQCKNRCTSECPVETERGRRVENELNEIKY